MRLARVMLLSVLVASSLAGCGNAAPGEADIARAVAASAKDQYAREVAEARQAVGASGAVRVVGAETPDLLALRKRRCREVSLDAGAPVATGFECAVAVNFRDQGWVEKTVVVFKNDGLWRCVQ